MVGLIVIGVRLGDLGLMWEAMENVLVVENLINRTI
jgi:hypothetical protein